jgi:23S rRNA (cytosine1962-C5)-methyltransferase
MYGLPGTLVLKPGKEKPLRQRHPWVFSGAVQRVEDAVPGGLVTIRDQKGNFLARGYYNPKSQIVARVLTWNEQDIINPDWWRARIQNAIDARNPLIDQENLIAYRLLYAESDGLPGLVVDRYGDFLVMQALTLGIDVIKRQITDVLADMLNPKGIIERSDVDVRRKEGLEETSGLLYGEMPPTSLTFEEYGLHYPVDLMIGHKTGFYLDQRESRRWLLQQNLAGAEVLNVFCYTGGFSACAGSRGATGIVNIDSSGPALELARQTLDLNNLGNIATEYVEADVFQQLRVYRDQQRRFDVIILDPPKFAHSARDVDRAARGYKDINLLAFQLLRPGGLLITFSCSGLIDPDLFQKIVFGASIDAGVQAQIIARIGQGADHPVLLAFPESLYLKGLVCRVCGF